MSEIIDIREAEAQLERLVERASSGEDIVIARDGTTMVRLVVASPGADRKPGALKHRGLRVPDSFFDPLPEEELARWE
jgi:antitoxin (DNA-binding transcriptional repressor) of toxin-antitoxin stability system